jgi:DNA-binding CsgD family transcriptional regulator
MFFRNVLFKYAFLVYTLFFLLPAYGQTDFRQLEEKVYQLNNAQKYNESQALLLPILESGAYTAEEKYQAAILLSYTYKRVSDYQSTLKFLSKARQFAQRIPHKDSATATISGQEAFVYFDIQQYGRSDSLMKLLAKTDYRYIGLESKAKLVMQQGYLLFLNKQYEQAEITYDRALVGLRASSPCDLPMILVKKMQLYAAMNRMDLLQNALKQSSANADSCGIIKYQLYGYEELLNIYKKRNDPAQIAATYGILDSLNKVYDKEVKLSALHNQQEAIIDSEKSQKLSAEQTRRNYLLLIMGSLLFIALLLALWFWYYRQQKEKEIIRMKAELERYMRMTQSAPPAEVVAEKQQLTTLSDRQRDVMDFMAKGMSNKEIADQLFISENTVKYHIKNIYVLLDIKDRKALLTGMRRDN